MFVFIEYKFYLYEIRINGNIMEQSFVSIEDKVELPNTKALIFS